MFIPLTISLNVYIHPYFFTLQIILVFLLIYPDHTLYTSVPGENYAHVWMKCTYDSTKK